MEKIITTSSKTNNNIAEEYIPKHSETKFDVRKARENFACAMVYINVFISTITIVSLIYVAIMKSIEPIPDRYIFAIIPVFVLVATAICLYQSEYITRMIRKKKK